MTAAPEVLAVRKIRPIGEQIIIRTIPVGSVGSILIPDSAQGITMMGTKGEQRASDYLINASLFDEILKVLREDAAGTLFRQNRRIRPKELLQLAEKARAAPPVYDYQSATHFVEAEVIAVGPGRRGRDPKLVEDMVEILKLGRSPSIDLGNEPELSRVNDLIDRAEHPRLQPLSVKPGDHILYHPAVQRFDRQVDLGDGREYFIIREESVLGILGREEAA